MTNDKYFPRVLIVGQSFDSTSGGGITMSNLFKDWPKDKLAVAGNIDRSPDLSVCNKYYSLGSNEYFLIWPLKYFQRTIRKSGQINFTELNNNDISDILKRKEGFLRRIIHEFIDSLGIEQLLRRLKLSKELLNWIDSFNPDVIYTQLAVLNFIRLVNKIQKKKFLPLIIHMMDDWPSISFMSGFLSTYIHWKMKNELVPLINKASGLMGISQKMCNVYKVRYNRDFIKFHNPIELNNWLPFSKINWTIKKVFRIIYTGRIGPANKTGINDIADVVVELYNEGYKIQFNLYTLEHCEKEGKQIERDGCVFALPPVPYSQMPQTLVEADSLILPLDFDNNSIKFSQYSMPTKTVEYMISGVPILVYAPEKLAMTEYAREDEWAYIVDQRNKKLLKKAIKEIMKDQQLRERLGKRAKQTAIKNHNSDNIREAFRYAIEEAAKGGK